MARSQVISRLHYDVAHLHTSINVPHKYQFPTPYDITWTRLIAPAMRLLIHPAIIGENKTCTAFKLYGVNIWKLSNSV